jgi:hypothetical protein
MKRSITSVHEGKKQFKCEVCDYSCAENIKIKRQMTLVHEENKMSVSYMKKGFAQVHEGKKPFKCEV